MFAKFIQISGRSSTLKILTGLILFIIIIVAIQQWYISPVEVLNRANVDASTQITTKETVSQKLTDHVIMFVEKLSWQQAETSQFSNALVLFVFLSLATSIGLPRQIAALVAGMNLGVLLGVVVATFAATLGCLITFSVSRYLLSGPISRKYPIKLAKLSGFLAEQTFLKAFIIRILPLGSNFLTNIVAGVTKVSMPAYVGGSFVGFIPQMIIFSLAGSGIRLGAQNELIASGALFIIALLLSAYLVKKHRAKLNAKSDTK